MFLYRKSAREIAEYWGHDVVAHLLIVKENETKSKSKEAENEEDLADKLEKVQYRLDSLLDEKRQVRSKGKEPKATIKISSECPTCAKCAKNCRIFCCVECAQWICDDCLDKLKKSENVECPLCRCDLKKNPMKRDAFLERTMRQS